MKFVLAAAVCFGAAALAALPASANDARNGSAGGAGYETSYETTQARGRGFGRRGGGGVVVAPRRRNNTGRNIAIGVGAAIVGGIIAN